MGTGTVMLVLADPSTNWFEESLESCSKIIWLVGSRLQFLHPDTAQPGQQNTKGSALLIWLPEHYGPCTTEYWSLSFIKKQSILERPQ